MTNWFEVYYSELIDFASGVILKRKLTADPSDLVNDAYVKFFESGKEFNLSDVKAIISGNGFKELDWLQSKTNFGDGFDKYGKKPRGSRVCNICNNTHPIGYFRVFKNIGFIYVANYCFDCEREKHKLQFRLWLKQGDNRDLWNRYMRNWRRGKSKTGLSKEEWNKQRAAKKRPLSELTKKASKKYDQKQKQNLTDVYIRKLIAHKKDLSPQAIERKRQELLAKRRMTNSLIQNKAA